MKKNNNNTIAFIYFNDHKHHLEYYFNALQNSVVCVYNKKMYTKFIYGDDGIGQIVAFFVQFKHSSLV